MQRADDMLDSLKHK